MSFQTVINGVTNFFVSSGKAFDAVLKYVLDIIDNRQIVRRITFLVTLTMTWITWKWALDLTEPSTQQIALLATVNALLGMMFKFYSESRDKCKKDE